MQVEPSEPLVQEEQKAQTNQKKAWQMNLLEFSETYHAEAMEEYRSADKELSEAEALGDKEAIAKARVKLEEANKKLKSVSPKIAHVQYIIEALENGEDVPENVYNMYPANKSAFDEAKRLGEKNRGEKIVDNDKKPSIINQDVIDYYIYEASKIVAWIRRMVVLPLTQYMVTKQKTFYSVSQERAANIKFLLQSLM